MEKVLEGAGLDDKFSMKIDVLYDEKNDRIVLYVGRKRTN